MDPGSSWLYGKVKMLNGRLSRGVGGICRKVGKSGLT